MRSFLCSLIPLLLCGALVRAPRAQEDGAVAAPAPVTVVCVRHAEKLADGSRDPALSEPGEVRAAALAHALGAAGVTHLFSTDYERTRATLAPLAAASGLEVALYSPANLRSVATDLRGLPPGSFAVVAGHSNTTPALVAALGVEDPPAQLTEQDYDRLWIVTVPGPEGAARLLDLRYGAESAAQGD